MKRGFVLGKFLPPHRGHEFMCNFAKNYVGDGEMTVLVCTMDNEPIPGKLRFDWMTEMLPNCKVVWCNENLPQVPEDDKDFWEIWKRTVDRYHPKPIDFLFASDSYGARLAYEVGASYVPVDNDRTAVPVSGTSIRSDPFGNWRFIPGPVRPYYTKRVVFFGAESTGKTMAAKSIANSLSTVYVPEYGRTFTEQLGTDIVHQGELAKIITGQKSARKAAAQYAKKIVVEDTDTFSTNVWSRMLFNRPLPLRLEFAMDDPADLYVMMDTSVPWVDDGTRYFRNNDDRKKFNALCIEELETSGLNHVIISGSDWDIRVKTATAFVENFFGV